MSRFKARARRRPGRRRHRVACRRAFLRRDSEIAQSRWNHQGSCGPRLSAVAATNIHLELPKAEVEFEGLFFSDSTLSGDFARLTVRNFQACMPRTRGRLSIARSTESARSPGSTLRSSERVSSARLRPARACCLRAASYRGPASSGGDGEDCKVVIRRQSVLGVQPWERHIGVRPYA